MKNIFLKRIAILVLFLPSAIFSRDSANIADGGMSELSIRKGIALVRITPLRYNDLMPWRTQTGSPYTVIGLVLRGDKLLVLSSDIQNASLIEVWKYSSYKKIIAKIEKRDVEANLAILSVSDPGFFRDLVPLSSERDPHVGRIVTAAMVDENFRVLREDVKITDVRASSDYGVATIPTLIFRTSEPFNGGGILLCGAKLCGFIGYMNKEKVAEAVLPSIVEAFQNASSDPFVSQGFEIKEMEDPVIREYYGLTADLTGAIVTRVLPGTSAYGVLRENDIILSIAGRKLDNRGFYNDPKFGLQKGQILFIRDGSRIRKSGETILLDILRDKKNQKVNVTLRAYEGGAERIPSIVEGPPSYLVESGYIFVELSLPYLRDGYGPAWRSRAIEMAYLFDTQRFMEKPGNERIVVLVGVFPDEVNRGYENLQSVAVKSVEGQAVTNLKQIYDTLSSSKKEYCILELSSGTRIYFSSRDRENANMRIRERYSLPALYKFRESK